MKPDALIRRCVFYVVVAAGLGLPTSPIAEEVILNKSLNEEILFIEKGSGLFSTKLETTVFKPAGNGPFPLVVINHGKAAGNTHFTLRTRFFYASQEFVKRGYAVMIPMRSGFSKSTGIYIGGGCNFESTGLAQAEDVRAALDYVKTLPYVDSQRIVIMGQSHGGLTTLAFGTVPYPGVRGLVNFAGGLRNSNCVAWEEVLVRAFEGYGAKNRYPTLWFYGDNDSYWSKEYIDKMYKGYVQSGGSARLIAFGLYSGGDAHSMFGQKEGLLIWVPEVEKFLAELGLPSGILPITEANLPVSYLLQEAGKKMELGSNCKKLFERYLEADFPRAFAIGGARCGYASGKNTLERAMKNCQRKTDANCKVVATNDVLVDGR